MVQSIVLNMDGSPSQPSWAGPTSVARPRCKRLQPGSKFVNAFCPQISWLRVIGTVSGLVLMAVISVYSVVEMSHCGHRTGEFVYTEESLVLVVIVLDDEEYEKRTSKHQAIRALSQRLSGPCPQLHNERRCSAALSGVMSRCGMPSISNPTINLRIVADRRSGG